MNFSYKECIHFKRAIDEFRKFDQNTMSSDDCIKNIVECSLVYDYQRI